MRVACGHAQAGVGCWVVAGSRARKSCTLFNEGGAPRNTVDERNGGGTPDSPFGGACGTKRLFFTTVGTRARELGVAGAWGGRNVAIYCARVVSGVKCPAALCRRSSPCLRRGTTRELTSPTAPAPTGTSNLLCTASLTCWRCDAFGPKHTLRPRSPTHYSVATMSSLHPLLLAALVPAAALAALVLLLAVRFVAVTSGSRRALGGPGKPRRTMIVLGSGQRPPLGRTPGPPAANPPACCMMMAWEPGW